MEAVNINFIVVGVTRLGIKPEATAPEADALFTRPYDLLNFLHVRCLEHRLLSLYAKCLITSHTQVFCYCSRHLLFSTDRGIRYKQSERIHVRGQDHIHLLVRILVRAFLIFHRSLLFGAGTLASSYPY